MKIIVRQIGPEGEVISQQELPTDNYWMGQWNLAFSPTIYAVEVEIIPDSPTEEVVG